MSASTRLLPSLLLLVSGLFLGAAQGAQPPTRVILVLDASGSMWGKVGDKTRIEIARETVAGLMKDWDPAIELGLMAYGHRREGDCKDIELLVPVSKTDPARIVKTVNALHPKGKTPLSEAVRQAAERLDYKKSKATVILVSDGEESCGADPCAVGAALKKAGADFTVHVVGFDVKKEERTGLVCLAKNTGGQFFAAKDASELKAALATAVKQAKQTPNVTITAVPRRGAKPFETTDYVSIHPLGPDGKPEEKQITGNHGNPTRFVLPTGRYQTRVKVGKGIAQADFEVKPEKITELTVVVGVGKVRITAVPKPGAKPFKSTNYVGIFPVGPDGKPTQKQLTGNYGNPTEFTLPAGRYQAEVMVGKGVGRADFEVKPEETAPITVVVGVGTVRLTFVPGKGAAPFPSTSYVRIYPLGPDGKPAKEQLTGYYGNPVTFTLPAGRYQVSAKVRENWSPSEPGAPSLSMARQDFPVPLAPFGHGAYSACGFAFGRPRSPCGPANTAGPQWLYASRSSATADYAPSLRSPWRAAIEVRAGEERNIEIVVSKP